MPHSFAACSRNDDASEDPRKSHIEKQTLIANRSKENSAASDSDYSDEIRLSKTLDGDVK
jgi:hypothetical protein